MKILITGHNGFLGKSIVSKLYKNDEIVGIDKVIDKDLLIRSIEHDLMVDSNIVEEEIKSSDVIIHLAGPVGVERIDYNYDTYLNDMLTINLNIFNLVKKYIYVNSANEIFSNSETLYEKGISGLDIIDFIKKNVNNKKTKDWALIMLILRQNLANFVSPV